MKRICTFNCQGLLDKTKQQLIADDFKKYRLKAMLLQELHMKNEGILNLKSTDGDQYHLYYSGNKTKSIHGVGILVERSTKVHFTPISDRICMISTNFDNKNQINMISAYAPTLDTTIKAPDVTEIFYSELESVIKLTNSRDTLLIGGDFNAKIKPNNKATYQSYIENVGKFSKGEINVNGEYLLEFSKRHNLKITNTFFKHKPCHITTWECPERIEKHLDSKSGKIRNNPYRNQIDFIMIRNNQNIQVNNSRSYGGMRTKSDHKAVIVEINIRWKYNKHQKSQPKVNYNLLHDQNYRNKYNNTVNNLLRECPKPSTTQDKWSNIVNITKKAAVETLGYIPKTEKYQNNAIKELSKQQQKIHLDQNSNNNPEKRKELRKKRNKILTQIHNLIIAENKNKIDQQLSNIENMPDDSRKMFQAVKNIKNLTPKTKLLIQTENGLTANEVEQANIIATYFKSQFYKNAEPLPQIPPTPMTIPFTSKEVQNAVKSLKNNKSPGNDEIIVELIKYAPTEIHEMIASIYNDMAGKGECPKEMTQGLLCAIQKPGKTKGPPQNLRPIILLSVIRKILAVCMMKRIGEKIDGEIPPSQAAYRKGRSTTEHVFSTKLVIERTLTSMNETVYLLMHDMSKAFDSINRTTLIKDLNKILQKDELHLVNKMLNVELSVKRGSYNSEYFKTDTDAPQGDCASANEFTFYLAKSLQNKSLNYEHDYRNLKEHDYSKQLNKNHITINQEYADDISVITSNPNQIKFLKNTLPSQLATRNLTINTSKTEEHKISRTNCDNSWKTCKLLGSLLDTENDIKRRKGLAIDALHKLKYIFNANKLSIATKVKAFNTYIDSIFLYNSDIWTLTTAREN